jgi:hypothetical protein
MLVRRHHEMNEEPEFVKGVMAVTAGQYESLYFLIQLV